jgi:hypothetical protein
MSTDPITSGHEQGDDEQDLPVQSPGLDEGDDVQGHLMVRTDETIAKDRKKHGSPLRS